MTDTVHALDPECRTPLSLTTLVGEGVSVSVPQLASAGYKWDVVADGEALGVSRLPSAPVEDAGIVGSGPPVVFSVVPRVPGEHVLTLEMRRPWEDAPRRRLAVHLKAVRPTLLDGLRR